MINLGLVLASPKPMEYLRELLSGPGQAAGGPDGLGRLARAGVGAGTPGGTPPAPFADALFEEGARAGPPQSALARRVAALDPEPPPGTDDPHIVGRESAPTDDMPEGDLSLDDLIDVINPLQHIPLVANLYRSLTGDTISGPARVAGGALYGGPFGMLAGAVNAIVAEVNGADLGDTVIAGLLGESPPGDIRVAGAPAGAVSPSVSDPIPALAASFAPPGRSQVLTGDAALSALFGDLGAENLNPGAPPESTPALSARAARVMPAQAFAHQMMQGLDKYRALAIERGGAGRPAPDRLDQRL